MDYYSFLQHGLDLPFMAASAGVGPSCNELIYVQVPSIYHTHAKKEPPVVMSDGVSAAAALQGAGNLEAPAAATGQADEAEMTEDVESVAKLAPEEKADIFNKIDRALNSAITKPLKVGSFGVDKEPTKDDAQYEKAMQAQGYGGAAKRRNISSAEGRQAKKPKINHSFKFN